MWCTFVVPLPLAECLLIRNSRPLQRRSYALCVCLFAHHAVSVGVADVLISGVPAEDGRDAVGTGLRAGDAAVPVDGNRNSIGSVITKSPGSSVASPCADNAMCVVPGGSIWVL